MTRIKILAALVAIACLSLSVAAYQQAGRGQAQARVVDVDKLRDNLYVLRGGGGNTAIFIAANGVVVVDTKNPGWGQPILEKIKTLTDKPVTTIINTHTHGDHVSGNVEFPATVEVIVHENTKANMMEMRGATGIPQQGPPTNIFKEHNGLGLPKRTFEDKMSIGTGNDRIDLFYFGRGHTNGDAWVLFRRYFCRQKSASSRCEQWRQRSPDRRQLSQSRQLAEERRNNHYWSLHDHDEHGRLARVRRVQ
ncbi:MAG: hypothetical protein DMG18_01015 [Acidobacteria bacterium]|nr:MAG: hypothetical protein DMG18_01015 [Acidobacteriota bacterium]